jgi:hypothetical protein
MLTSMESEIENEEFQKKLSVIGIWGRNNQRGLKLGGLFFFLMNLQPEESFLLLKNDGSSINLHRNGSKFWLESMGQVKQLYLQDVECLENVATEDFQFKLSAEPEIIYTCRDRKNIVECLVSNLEDEIVPSDDERGPDQEPNAELEGPEEQEMASVRRDLCDDESFRDTSHFDEESGATRRAGQSKFSGAKSPQSSSKSPVSTGTDAQSESELQTSISEFAATMKSRLEKLPVVSVRGRALVDVIDVWEEKAVSETVTSSKPSDARVQRTFKIFKQFRVGWVRGKAPSSKWRSQISSALRSELEELKAQATHWKQEAAKKTEEAHEKDKLHNALRREFFGLQKALQSASVQKTNRRSGKVGEGIVGLDMCANPEAPASPSHSANTVNRELENFINDTDVPVSERFNALKARFDAMKRAQSDERLLFDQALRASGLPRTPLRLADSAPAPLATFSPAYPLHSMAEASERLRCLTLELVECQQQKDEGLAACNESKIALDGVKLQLRNEQKETERAQAQLAQVRSNVADLEVALANEKSRVRSLEQELSAAQLNSGERDSREEQALLRLGQLSQKITKLKNENQALLRLQKLKQDMQLELQSNETKMAQQQDEMDALREENRTLGEALQQALQEAEVSQGVPAEMARRYRNNLFKTTQTLLEEFNATSHLLKADLSKKRTSLGKLDQDLETSFEAVDGLMNLFAGDVSAWRKQLPRTRQDMKDLRKSIDDVCASGVFSVGGDEKQMRAQLIMGETAEALQKRLIAQQADLQKSVKKWDEREKAVKELANKLTQHRESSGQMIDKLVENLLSLETTCDDYSALLAKELDESLLAGDKLLPDPIPICESRGTQTFIASGASSNHSEAKMSMRPSWNSRFNYN